MFVVAAKFLQRWKHREIEIFARERTSVRERQIAGGHSTLINFNRWIAVCSSLLPRVHAEKREVSIRWKRICRALAAIRHDASARRGATTCSMTFPFDDCNKWGPPRAVCSSPALSPKPFYHRQPFPVSHSTSGQIIQRGAAIPRKIGIFERAVTWPVIDRSQSGKNEIVFFSRASCGRWYIEIINVAPIYIYWNKKDAFFFPT